MILEVGSFVAGVVTGMVVRRRLVAAHDAVILLKLALSPQPPTQRTVKTMPKAKARAASQGWSIT